MGCQIGRIIIVNNEGTIIFGNVAAININETSVSANGTNSPSRGTSSADNAESAQNAANASDSRTVSDKRSKRHRYKPR